MTAIYFWCTGQEDNIGDIVLRRRLLRSLTAIDANAAVYIGRASKGFVEAMQFSSQSLYTSRVAWTIRLCISAVCRPSVLVHNPGEIRLDQKTVKAQVALLVPQVLLRLRGGQIVRIGCAVAERSGWTAQLAKALILLSGRMTTISRWRDSKSPSQFGDFPTAPDWAFDEGGPSGNDYRERNTMVLTFRSDRAAVSQATIREIANLAVERGLSIRVLVQVRRDQQAMSLLADQIDGVFVGWPDDRSHSEQERIVRDEFRRARVVISDRIHALIIASTEGAIPAGVMGYRDVKVGRHFDTVGVDGIVWSSESSRESISEFLDSLIAREPDLAAQFHTARTDVRSLDSVLAEVLGRKL